MITEYYSDFAALNFFPGFTCQINDVLSLDDFVARSIEVAFIGVNLHSRQISYPRLAWHFRQQDIFSFPHCLLIYLYIREK